MAASDPKTIINVWENYDCIDEKTSVVTIKGFHDSVNPRRSNVLILCQHDNVHECVFVRLCVRFSTFHWHQKLADCDDVRVIIFQNFDVQILI